MPKNIYIILLLLFVTTSCGVDFLFTPGESSSISGRLISTSSISSLSTESSFFSLNTCHSPIANLYLIDDNGVRIEPNVATTSLTADGSYSFPSSVNKLSFKGEVPIERAMVEIRGCDEVFTRPLTGQKNQNVSSGTSLIGFMLNTSEKDKLVTVLEDVVEKKKLDEILTKVSTATTVQNAYDFVNTNTVLSNSFTAVLRTPVTTLVDASPTIDAHTIPAIGQELSSISLGITTVFWQSSYNAGYKWELDGVTIGTSKSITWTPSANAQGSHVIKVSVGESDGSGGIDTSKPLSTISKTVVIANNSPATAPAFSVSTPTIVGTNPINTRSLTLSINTGTNKANCDSFSSLAFNEGNASPPSASNFTFSCTTANAQLMNVTLATAGDGPKVIRLWAIDASGNISAAATSTTVYIDSAPPTVQITNTVAAVSGSPSQSFTFVGDDNGGIISGYACSIDGGAYAACSSPANLSGLAQGTHTFAVKALDTAGNSSPVDSKSWVIDLTAPTLTLGSTPNSITKDVTSTFTFSAVDTGGASVAGFKCKMDSGAYASCVSPYVTVLSAGNHTLSVTAVDTAGNTSSAVSYSWAIDLTAPTVSISSGPLAVTNATTASLVFSGTDTGGGTVASYSCSVDGAAASPCTSPASLSSLTSGAHNFTVTTTDTAGNTSVVASKSWTVDLSAPTATIASKPASITNSTTGTFTFTATDTGGGVVSSFQCKLDAGSYSTCTSPVTLTSLAEGSHTFAVQALDSAGNTSTDATYTWTIDRTPPLISLGSTPNSITNATSASLAFSATDSAGSVASFSCALDGGSFAACTSPFNATSLAAGSHTISVKSTDDSGNVSVATTYTWIVDLAGPTTTITSFPSTLTNQTGATFAFAATDTGGGSVDYFECQIDGGGFSTCATGKSYTGLTAGAHSFNVRAIDTATNTGAAVTSNWTIDLTTPLASINSNPASITNSTTAAFTFSANPPSGGSITGYLCSIDGGAFSSCSSPATYSALTQGAHTFGVKSVDNNSNVSTPVTYNWTVDLTNPTVAITSTPTAFTSSASAAFVFTSADTGGGSVAGQQCKLDAASYAACSSPSNLSALSEGAHTFSVISMDTAGNTSAAATYSWTVDKTSPVLSITSTPASVTKLQTASIVFSATDALGTVASYACAVDGAAAAACTSPLSLSGLAAGAHSVSITTTDNSGNTSSASTYAWTIDLTPPTVAINSKPSLITNATAATFAFSATDAGGGTVASFSCKLDAEAYAACTSPVTRNTLAAGSHTYSITATDSVGNTSTAVTYTWSIDTTAPTVAINTKPTANSNSTAATFTFSATDTGGGAIDSYSCMIDSGSYAACSSPANYSSLAEGAHTFSVKALDTAGNSSTAVSYTWGVDTTAPVPTIGTKPAALTNATTANFTFTATDAGTISSYSCSVDGAAYSTCTSPQALSSLAAGSHSFGVKATDNSGNISLAVTHSWTIDLTPPVITIASTPASITNATGATFTFSATDSGGGSLASYQCKMDSGSYVACSSPQVYSSLTQASHTFYMTSTDTAGNTSAPSSYTWTIDTTAPTVSVTTPSANGAFAQTSGLSSYALAGACSENGLPVSITGSVSTTATCSAGAWSTNINISALADGTLSITAAMSDAAGNTSANATRTFIKDTVLPVINITAPSPMQGNGSYGTATWAMSEGNALATPATVEFYNGSSWSTVGTKTATAGSNSNTAYTLSGFPVPNVDITTAKIRVSYSDASGNFGTTTTGTFMVDSTLPVLSSFTVNNGTASTTNNNIPVSFTATDANKVSYLCFKYNDSTQPAGTDSCWNQMSNTGVAAATSVSVSNFYTRIGLLNGTYTLYAWVKDSVGNVSANTATSGVDKGAVSFVAGIPPAVSDVTATSTNSPQTPMVTSDQIVSAGQTVYIKWNATSTTGLSATGIQLFYTLNDTTWIPIGTGLANAAGAGCSISGSQTGCYTWTNGSPTSVYFRVKVQATDTSSYVGQNLSGAVNATQFRLLAGNTESGLGGSASSAVFLTTVQSDPRKGDARTLIVHPNGTIYFKDASRGILKVDPSDGILKVVVPVTGVSSGDGGPASSATLNTATWIAFDYQNNILVWDNNRIRKININLSTPTISTFIGGGSQTADNISDPLQINLGGISRVYSYLTKFHPLPNGDLIFKSQCIGTNADLPLCTAQYRWYHADTNSITTIYVNGLGIPGHPEIDIKNCAMHSIAPVLDVNGQIQNFVSHIQAVPTGSSTGCSYNTTWNNFGVLLDTSGNFISNYSNNYAEAQLILGRNGLTYQMGRLSGHLSVYNPSTNSFVNITNSGLGLCADGVQFGSCKMTLDDMFIDQNGKYYFPERGKIRTVADDGTVVTIMGQSLSYGDGLDPVKARFGAINSLGLWHDGTNYRLTMLDTVEHRFRETALDITTTISTIAGSALTGTPNTTTAANVQGIYDVGSNVIAYFFAQDPNGNIYYPSGANLIGKLSRSTGLWSNFIGGGATNFYDGDGLAGTSVKFSESNAMGGVLGYGGGQVATRLANIVTSLANYPSIKMYSTSTGLQSAFAGAYGTGYGNYSLCALGTSLSSCNIASAAYTSSVSYSAYDGTWYVLYGSGGNIFKMTPGGTFSLYQIGIYPSKAFTVYKDATHEYLYNCDATVTPNKIRKVDVTANTWSYLYWPISSVNCDGSNMIYSAARNSLIFTFKQAGLNGVIEYPNP